MCSGTRSPLSDLDVSPQLLGIFGPEVEDLPHFDPARGPLARLRHFGEFTFVMCLVRAGIARGELLQNRLALRDIVVVDLARAECSDR